MLRQEEKGREKVYCAKNGMFLIVFLSQGSRWFAKVLVNFEVKTAKVLYVGSHMSVYDK